MDYIVTRNHFEKCKDILWDDVIFKIDFEICHNSHKIIISDNETIPTIVLHNNFYPKTIQTAFDEVKDKIFIRILHIYTSFSRDSKTFGRHCDDEDVILVQSKGKTGYKFDNGEEIILSPGDSLFIPKGVYHDPILYEPRVTLSFSW